MATFAFFPSPITGAINPFLGLGHDLTALGHRVVFYLPEGYRDTVGAVGAELRTYRLERARPHRPGDDAVTRFAHTPMWLTAECRQVLPQIEPDVRALATDVIVYHMICVWGRLLARLMPAAAAMVVGSYVGNEHFSPVRTAHYQAMAGKLADAFGDYSADVAALGRRYGLRLQPRELFAREERLVPLHGRVTAPARLRSDRRAARARTRSSGGVCVVRHPREFPHGPHVRLRRGVRRWRLAGGAVGRRPVGTGHRARQRACHAPRATAEAAAPGERVRHPWWNQQRRGGAGVRRAHGGGAGSAGTRHHRRPRRRTRTRRPVAHR